MDLVAQAHGYVLGVFRYFSLYSKLGDAKRAVQNAEYGALAAAIV